ncbi:MAG TPA: methionyl-tRNA formyltransferase [Pyrinomonadaceae bacterium]|nr:methionyl-tRNA formyltransferase [Pyrinomonadaceae bacterium]
MGTPEAAVPSLRRVVEAGHEVVAVWTQPDKPAGRGHKLTASPVKLAAALLGLKVHQPSKIRTPEAKSLFASHQADLAIVVAYGKILPTEFLRAPRRGCINVHFSLLPHYRGAAPVNWAIVNGEQQTGVTTMIIEEELDSGPILLQKATEIEEGETAPHLMLRLADMGAELLAETLKQLDEIRPQPQQHADASFAPVLKRSDGLIDWTRSAAAIERRVRGFQPWPNAYTHHNGSRIVIWRAAAHRSTDQLAAAGEVVEAAGDNLVVRCGKETALRLLEIQPEAKRRMKVRDYLNGAQLELGARFQ